MKKISLVFGLILLGLPAVFAQGGVHKKLKPATTNDLELISRSTDNASRSLSCDDTLRYPQIKEQLLGASDFYNFECWKADAEKISQTFLNTTSHSIRGIEFFGRNAYRPGAGGFGVPSITVVASIYNVNASNVPTTLVGSGTMTVTDTNNAYRRIMFVSPITVTGNYAVVLETSTTNGIVGFFVNDATPGQAYDENLSRYISNYYTGSSGAWVNIPTLTGTFTGGPFDFEPLVAPLISYTINTDFTVSPNPVCLGNAVTINNTTTPSALLSSRFYNFGAFLNYFLPAYTQDSVYVWDMDDSSPLIWNTNTSYTYAAAGSYDATMFTLGGLWTSCTDSKVVPIVVNPLDNATFSYASNTVCSGSSNPVPTIAATGTFSSTPAGLTFASTSTGEIDMASSTDGTYSVTFTTSGPCPQTSTQSFTITSAPSADFSYANTSYCTNGSDPSVVLDPGASNGVYSSTTGLTINPSTGVIDLSASTAGTYTVTNTIAASGACPAATATFNVTVNAIPSISFTPASVCSNVAPVTLTAAPAGGTFSGTGVSGNQFNPSAGTQTVTYSYTDANSCSNSSNALITVHVAPTANFAADTACTGGSAITLTATPTGGVFSGTGVTGNQFDPASGTQTLTYIYTDGNGCSDTANAVVTVNSTPSVSWTAPGTQCINYAAITLSGGTPAGGAYAGTGVSAGQFNPATAGIGTHAVTYSFTSNGCTGTATGNIVVSACLGIEEETSNTISVYPNPSTGLVTFAFDTNDKEVVLQLVTTTGQIVYTHTTSTNKVVADLSSLAKAVYYVHVTVDGKTSTSKLVLQ